MSSEKISRTVEYAYAARMGGPYLRRRIVLLVHSQASQRRGRFKE